MNPTELLILHESGTPFLQTRLAPEREIITPTRCHRSRKRYACMHECRTTVLQPLYPPSSCLNPHNNAAWPALLQQSIPSCIFTQIYPTYADILTGDIVYLPENTKPKPKTPPPNGTIFRLHPSRSRITRQAQTQEISQTTQMASPPPLPHPPQRGHLPLRHHPQRLLTHPLPAHLLHRPRHRPRLQDQLPRAPSLRQFHRRRASPLRI